MDELSTMKCYDMQLVVFKRADYVTTFVVNSRWGLVYTSFGTIASTNLSAQAIAMSCSHKHSPPFQSQGAPIDAKRCELACEEQRISRLLDRPDKCGNIGE